MYDLIQQVFKYDGVEILRIFHENFDDEPSGSHITSSQVKSLQFIESKLDQLPDEVLSFDTSVAGFLPCQHPKNPYSTYSCNYRELISLNKNYIESGIISDPALFNQISEFVLEWSGFKLKDSPYSLYNTLFFSNTMIELDMRQEKNNVKVDVKKSAQSELILMMKFKLFDIVVDTHQGEVTQGALVQTNAAWNNIDVEILSNNHLVYAYYNLHFIRSIRVNLNFVSKTVPATLNKAKRQIHLNQMTPNQIVAGDESSESLVSYFYHENLTAKNLHGGNFFTFLKTDQYNEAVNALEGLIDMNTYEEMWVFDPYFLDVAKAKGRLDDLVKLLSKHLNTKKYIVFESSHASPFEDFRRAVKSSIDLLNKHNSKLGFTFLGTKVHFHDRFLFFKSRELIKGYLIGTSLHSLGDNYSSIIELNQSNAHKVFTALMEDVADDKYLNTRESL